MDIECGSFMKDWLPIAVNMSKVSADLIDTALAHLYSVQARACMALPSL